MNCSETIKNLTASLLEAQKSIKPITKTSQNPFFKSMYADLTSVIDGVKEPLNNAGVIVLQPVNGDFVETTLIDAKSGEWISSSTKIVVANANDPQKYGSAVTYARRYGLMSILTIPAEDDDAEGAMERPSQPHPADSNNRIACRYCQTTGVYHKKGCPNALKRTDNTN